MLLTLQVDFSQDYTFVEKKNLKEAMVFKQIRTTLEDCSPKYMIARNVTWFNLIR